MSKKHKKQALKVSKGFQLIDGKPMTQTTQWFLIGAVSATVALKLIEASVLSSYQLVLGNPDFITSNIWVSLFG